MQLYNTLSRKKEQFVPITPGKVGVYVCGITAYDLCHIGHARSAIVFDVLVRYLRSLDYDVTFVRNFTDVDDKIINRAVKEHPGTTDLNAECKAIAEKYIAAFHEDMDALHVLRADIEPKATESIQEMIAICNTLIGKGAAYATASGDVYFRVRAFPAYGKLSGRNIDEMRAGARIAIGEEKEDPLDFALWKSAKPEEPHWPSPWGPGRPGWHIECSAMSEKYLPLPFDIHGGGLDLIFPHHENEIAQTEAATGKELAKFWVHNGFVQNNAEKMSKSLGNFMTIRDILQNYLPEVLRFFLLARQYRSPIDFTTDAMEEAEKNLKRMYETFAAIDEELKKTAPTAGKLSDDIQTEFSQLKQSWQDALADDLNTAAALGHVNGLIRLINRILDDKGLRKNAGCRSLLEDARQIIQNWSSILGVFAEEPTDFLSALKLCRAKRKKLDISQIEKLMQKRHDARAAKDFAASDAVRDELAALGVEIRDTPAGALWDIA